jgi:hypothetical protein
MMLHVISFVQFFSQSENNTMVFRGHCSVLMTVGNWNSHGSIEQEVRNTSHLILAFTDPIS